MLILGSSKLFRSYLESVLVFASKCRSFDEKIYIFEIEEFYDQEMHLKKYEFSENQLKISD